MSQNVAWWVKGGRAVRVEIDEARCEGFGLCNEHLPETFVLDEAGYASVTEDGVVPAGEEEFALRAVDGCPTKAIRIVEE